MMKKNKIRSGLLVVACLISLSNPVWSQTIQEGISLYNQGNYQKAIEVLKQASSKDPTNPEPHLWLSKSYEALFDIDKSLAENQLYESLKATYKKPSATPTPTPKPKETPLIDPDEEDEELKGVLAAPIPNLDEKFINEQVSNRELTETGNKKPLNIDEIKMLFSQVPGEDADNLPQFTKRLEIMKLYNIASHQDEILLKKADADQAKRDLMPILSRYESESNPSKKFSFEKELKRIKRKFLKSVGDLTVLINKPVYTHTDPLSIEYFNHLDIPKEIFLRDMNNKKANLNEFLKDAENNIRASNNDLSKFYEEIKNLKVKEEWLSGSVPENLSDAEKTALDQYNEKQTRISELTESIANYRIEEKVLIDSISKINKVLETVKVEPTKNIVPKTTEAPTSEVKPEPSESSTSSNAVGNSFREVSPILVGERYTIHFTAISADSRFAAVESEESNGEIKIWELSTAKPTGQIFKMDQQAKTIAFSPNGKMIAAGELNGKIWIWDYSSGKLLKKLDNKKSTDSLLFDPESKFLITDGFSKINVWNIQTGKNISPIKDTIPVKYIRLHPSGGYIVTANGYGNGSASKEINVWDILNGKRILNLKHTNANANIGIFTEDGKNVVTSDWDVVKVWNNSGVLTKTVEVISAEEKKKRMSIKDITASPDGKFIAVALGVLPGNPSRVKILETNKFTEVQTLTIDKYGLEQLAFSPDSRYLLGRIYGGILHVWKR